MIIILFPYKFNNSYFKKYQIKELKKKFKNKIEIHDLFNIISKKWQKGASIQRNKSALVFNDLNQWKNHLKKILKKENKIFVVNTISSNSFKSFFIHYLLFKYKVKLIKLNSPEVYAPAQSNTLYLKLISFLKNLFFNFPKLFFILKNIFYNKLLYLLNFDELYILYSGSRKYLLPLTIRSKKLFFIKFHASDFANYLTNKKKNNLYIKKNYIVFLDIKPPAFPGDDVSFNDKIIYNASKWYKDLNNFLKKVEKKFNSKVIIVPHPSVRHLKNIYYDKKFNVSKDPDASNKLISKSKFVIANGATTAVSYCVIHDKPITFIYNNQVIKKNPTMFFETKNLSRYLSSKSININDKFDKKNFCLKINKRKYLKYKYNFLTSKNIQNIQNSEILKKLISNDR
jgi:hypothetical protein